jgi:hypothetical protein
VPEPICPIGIQFVALVPTRTPICSPDITIKSPVSADAGEAWPEWSSAAAGRAASVSFASMAGVAG